MAKSSGKISETKVQHHRVGFHATTAGGHYKAIEEGNAFGCEIIQLFTKSNLQWGAKPIPAADLKRYKEAKKESPITSIFGHSGYLINLAATNPDTLQKSRESLVLELERSAELELPFLVLHPGAARGRSEKDALDLVIESLEWVFTKTSSPTLVALECTAGSGTVLGSTIEQLAYLIDHTPTSKRLAICLDTCHLFASGYDLRTAADMAVFLKKFKKLIDWKRVAAIHMNDSLGELGSKKDRHAPLGEGKIGWECFRNIMQHKDFAHLPLCMEIPPGDERINDVKCLKKLKAARA